MASLSLREMLADYPLHESVFNNDLKRLSALLRTRDVSEKDVHGNTALHLAAMLGHKECIHLLLTHDAPVRLKNALGWNSLAEAVSYGDRPTITTLLRKLKQQSRESLEAKRPQLIQALEDLGDFYMEVRWDFQSWVPLVSRMLPSDTCRILKRGTRVRMDTTLVDFNDMQWQRGNNTFLFNGDAKPDNSLVILDNDNKLFQRVRYQETEKELEEEVDILMSSDVVTMTLSTKPITFTRAQSGWLFREKKCEMIGNYYAHVYTINNVIVETRKRRGHLSEEDVQKNKAALESLSKGRALPANLQPQYRKSLPAPPATDIRWSEYIKGRPSRAHLGRPEVCKESKKVFKATVAMSEDFPMDLPDLLNILEVLTPMRHFQKLRDFVSMKMPPGFPIKIDVPVLPTITARVTFQDFQYRDNILPSLFKIPRDYTLDSSRCPEI
ncbi:ankyrin repeat domain-containing protein 13C-like isoform X2 [Acanthaster planci]|uniref:Ankyrin repeat domain-containing protein 13C-like isoform X2 n=1 Tax=Acanthaster planci TaxID=133434 RepID=A0A8B7Y677_ACAPL|nr:ankyrin repeat domain-containing protein 13C-like isoform X2 [Acanthaster planci]